MEYVQEVEADETGEMFWREVEKIVKEKGWLRRSSALSKTQKNVRGKLRPVSGFLNPNIQIFPAFDLADSTVKCIKVNHLAAAI